MEVFHAQMFLFLGRKHAHKFERRTWLSLKQVDVEKLAISKGMLNMLPAIESSLIVFFFGTG